MTLLHIDTGFLMRGGQELLLQLARALRRRGHTQTIACPQGSALAAALAAEGFALLELPHKDPLYWSSPRRVRRFLKSNPCEIVHAHDGRGQTIAWLGSAGLPVRRLASRHVLFEPRHPLIHRLKYTHTCHHVVAPSEPVRRLLLRMGLPPEHVTVIPGGVDWPTQLPGEDARRRGRTALGFAGDHFVVGNVSAFTAEKGQTVALDALALVLEQHPEVRMVLVGEGPLREAPAILERVRRAGGAAVLPGYIGRLTDFYAACDVFVMPSLSESFGLAPLHAMAHGLPVIATNVGGLPEIVRDRECGWLVPPGDPRALAEAILEALVNPVERKSFGVKAREQARSFSIAAAAERTERLYHALIGESGNRRAAGNA